MIIAIKYRDVSWSRGFGAKIWSGCDTFVGPIITNRTNSLKTETTEMKHMERTSCVCVPYQGDRGSKIEAMHEI